VEKHSEILLELIRSIVPVLESLTLVYPLPFCYSTVVEPLRPSLSLDNIQNFLVHFAGSIIYLFLN